MDGTLGRPPLVYVIALIKGSYMGALFDDDSAFKSSFVSLSTFIIYSNELYYKI